MITTKTSRHRLASGLLWIAMPFLGLTYQIAAKHLALETVEISLGPAWLAAALDSHWGQVLIIVEILSFVAWMTVLSEISLSVAFPLSALSYVLVIVASRLVFHEAGNSLQILGSWAILTGIWLLGREPLQ